MRVQNQASLGGGNNQTARSGKAPTGNPKQATRRSAAPTGNQKQATQRSKAPTGNPKNHFIKTEVDSPYNENAKTSHGKQRTERVTRRVSDNPLLQLLSRGKISQAEFLAGHKYLAAHLICTGQTGQGIDYSRQRVDCSLAPMSLSEKQMHASDLIRNANRELKAEGKNEKSPIEATLRIQKIAGEGLNVTQYCKLVRGLTSNKSISKQLGFLKDDLSVLAKFWGFEK